MSFQTRHFGHCDQGHAQRGQVVFDVSDEDLDSVLDFKSQSPTPNADRTGYDFDLCGQGLEPFSYPLEFVVVRKIADLPPFGRF